MNVGFGLLIIVFLIFMLILSPFSIVQKFWALAFIIGGAISAIYGISYNNSTKVQLNNTVSQYGIMSKDNTGLIFIIGGLVAIVIGIILLMSITKNNSKAALDNHAANNINYSENSNEEYDEIVETLNKIYNLYKNGIYNENEYKDRKGKWIEGLKKLNFTDIEDDFLNDILPLVKDGALSSDDLDSIKYITSGKYAKDKEKN